ncbi:putative trans-sialidase [Trypanosoma cruzi]|nr:putative trans-sialidase [Trypanosoma cruzi]
MRKLASRVSRAIGQPFGARNHSQSSPQNRAADRQGSTRPGSPRTQQRAQPERALWRCRPTHRVARANCPVLSGEDNTQPCFPHGVVVVGAGLTASTGARSSRAVTGHSRNTTGSGDTSCCNASRRIYLRKHERKTDNTHPAWPHPPTAVPMLTSTLPFPSPFSNSIPIPHPTPTMDTRKAAKRQKERNQTTTGMQIRAEERARQRTKQRDARNGYAHAGIIVVETRANY